MKRRDFLVGGMALAQSLAARPLFAQQPVKRAAIVIGVDKTDGMPVLRAAVSGAKKVAEWLDGEGFRPVRVLTDDQGPITAAHVKAAAKQLVETPSLEQLVIYFGGHGIAFNTTELWLLTHALTDPDEAISVTECAELARATPIPKVAFISDACRSIPTFDVSRIRGSLIFPLNPPRADAEVDRFFATLLGASAYELTVAVNEYGGIYTHTLLEAFSSPDNNMVNTVNGVKVITNRNLKLFLKREVPKRLSAQAIQRNQIPDSRVESPADVYIGRAMTPVMSAAPPPPSPTTILDVVDSQFKLTGVGSIIARLDFQPASPLKQIEIEQLKGTTGFDAAQKAITNAKQPNSFESKTGFAVNGARVAFALAAGEHKAEIIDEGDGLSRPALIRIRQSVERPISVVIGFADGSGTVIAALPGFIGTIVVDRGRVMNVSYVPSRNSDRWSQYEGSRSRIDGLHALVAASAKFGLFRIDGDKESRNNSARRIADQIRILKGIDPTLGLYAAYAYADANLIGDVKSVRSFMRDDLNADVFDIALLAGGLSDRNLTGPEGPVPFCPMLAQGWQLLRVRGVRLLEEIRAAQDHQRRALWTTFDPEGMNFVRKAVDRRVLR